MKYCLLFLFSLLTIAATAQEYKLEGNEVKIEKPIVFETGSDKLKPESNAALEIIKQYLEAKSYISLLRIECHSDNSGDNTANQLLTEKRALAICKALVKMEVDCKRLLPVGFGGNKPIVANDTIEGKAANRRVQFVNAELRSRAIGGMPVDGGGKVAGESCK